jgi:hypothetical protein
MINEFAYAIKYCKKEILVLLILSAVLIGWIMNIVAVAHTVDIPITGMFFVRIAGILIVPLGGVLGYL